MTRGMIPADLFRMQWVSDARSAPDGRTLAFTVTRLDEEADDYRSNIWVVPADGSTPPSALRVAGARIAPHAGRPMAHAWPSSLTVTVARRSV